MHSHCFSPQASFDSRARRNEYQSQLPWPKSSITTSYRCLASQMLHCSWSVASRENCGFSWQIPDGNMCNCIKVKHNHLLFKMNDKVKPKFNSLWHFINMFVHYQLFSPSLQCVTLFLPVWGSSREFLHGAVSIEPSLSLCLLLGQVAFLITGPGST